MWAAFSELQLCARLIGSKLQAATKLIAASTPSASAAAEAVGSSGMVDETTLKQLQQQKDAEIKAAREESLKVLQVNARKHRSLNAGARLFCNNVDMQLNVGFVAGGR